MGALCLIINLCFWPLLGEWDKPGKFSKWGESRQVVRAAHKDLIGSDFNRSSTSHWTQMPWQTLDPQQRYYSWLGHNHGTFWMKMESLACDRELGMTCSIFATMIMNEWMSEIINEWKSRGKAIQINLQEQHKKIIIIHAILQTFQLPI